MAEQQNQPPDLSPTTLPQPPVGPAGCYTYLQLGQSINTIQYTPRDNEYQADPSFNLNTYSPLKSSTQYTPSKRSVSSSHTAKPLSIEDLLQGVWTPSGVSTEPVTAMLNDRIQVQSLALDDVLRQIKERITLYHQHVDELEHAKVAVRNVRRRWTDPMDKIGEVPDPELVSEIHNLESQQRQERLSAWKDLSSLRQQVPEHWQQYLGAQRQQSCLPPPPKPPESPSELSPQTLYLRDSESRDDMASVTNTRGDTR